MKNKVLLFILILCAAFFFNTDTAYAKEKNTYNEYVKVVNKSVNNNTQILSGNIIQIGDCSGSNAVFGNVNDPDSVAWLLQKLLNYIKVLGPFIVLIMSSLDYVKAILASDDDSIKNANKKLVTRLVLIVVLFLLPQLVSFALNVLGFTSHEVCGLQ